MGENTLVTANNISVTRAKRLILDNISLDVQAGEIVTIIGPNGAGKTTLIKILLGIDKKYYGSVSIKSGITIGYVPQSFVVSPFLPMSVRRFLQLAGQYTAQEIEAALHQLQTCYLIDEKLQTLSGGEMQRVLLARAILKKPDILVLDEPAQNMDIGGQIAFYEHIKTIRDQLQCGVLLVSHDLNLVMSATDKVICMHRHICCSGHPDKVAQMPEFLDLFGKQAVETLAIYRHQHNHTHGGWDKNIDCEQGHEHAR